MKCSIQGQEACGSLVFCLDTENGLRRRNLFPCKRKWHALRFGSGIRKSRTRSISTQQLGATTVPNRPTRRRPQRRSCSRNGHLSVSHKEFRRDPSERPQKPILISPE